MSVGRFLTYRILILGVKIGYLHPVSGHIRILVILRPSVRSVLTVTSPTRADYEYPVSSFGFRLHAIFFTFDFVRTLIFPILLIDNYSISNLGRSDFTRHP